MMSSRGNTAASSGQYKRKLNDLGFTLVAPSPATKPTGQELANLSAPTQFYVCILDQDNYIAVTKLRSCTGLAVYDATSKLAGMYHFGGQFGNEQAEVGKFVKALNDHNIVLGDLQMWLFGSTKCGHADKLFPQLRMLGFTQTPVVMEIDGVANQEAAFYLLGTGVVTNQLT